MSASSELDDAIVSRGAAAIQARLDPLTIGDYDRAVLLRAAYDLARTAPDDVCEILSTVDQYFRRGKIRAEDYRQLKARLGALLVNGERDTPRTAPPPRWRDPAAPSDVTAPVGPAPDAPPAGPSAGGVAAPPAGSPTAARALAIGARCLAVGDTLRGRYRVTGIVGQGGMGTIYEVVDQTLSGIGAGSRRLAVKMLHTEVTQRPELLRELLTEFLNLQSLSHPNILRVHDFDRDGDAAFLTMELLEGSTLGHLVSGQGGASLASGHARAIVHAVGMALAHAHSRGVVHGDVNPQNLFLTANGEVRVLDFGSSQRVKIDPSIAAASGHQPLLMATLRYASCEVLEGRGANASDDLFALACVAYVLLSGKHPFANRTAVEARAAGLSPSRPRGLSARHWRALRQGLELRRDRRPADIGRWVRRLNAGVTVPPLPALSALLPASSPRSRSALPAAVAAMLILMAAAGLWLAHAHGPLQPAAATGTADAAAAFVTARTSFVRIWNRALRSAVIGDATAGATGTGAARAARPSKAHPPHPPPGDSSSPGGSP
ncbi:MAG TPA: serine/threonine-protein kinase [Steroidobacteraceae bacterium]|nr:serine/threonine-protein kinase [Steroidobacteraceae bacterium]